MSSSCRQASPCEASLFRDDKALGPLRLPMEDQDAFVAQFNRLYHQAGMIASPNSNVVPASPLTKDVPAVQGARQEDADG